LNNICQDLACAGFLAFNAEHRHACPHTEMTNAGPPGDGQQDPPSDGRPPQQTDDVQRAIRAARTNGLCNGKVVLLGFSGGAGHVAWWAIAGTTMDDKPEAIVGCSGPYNVGNADLLATPSKDDVENYIGHHTDEGQTFIAAAKAASSYWLPITSTPCPVLLFNGTNETIPQSELSDMVGHLNGAGGSVEYHWITGSKHAADYWCKDYDDGNGQTVKDRSIEFLKGVLGIQ
jgi:acetyl esterase/lipase